MNSFFYKLTLSYCGARYYGWQIQTETTETIQGKLNNAFKKATNSSEVKTIGAGRTDAGVHAFGQIVRLECENDLPPSAFLKGVNNHLPHDIKILAVEKVDDRFHPVFSAKEKEYLYVFTQKDLGPFFSQLMTYYPLSLEQMQIMESGLKLFLGKHDFINYRCVGTDVNSTVREIYDVEIGRHKEFHFINYSLKGDFIVIKMKGEGFLKQMVRLMMGALLSLSEGKIQLSDIEESLNKPMERKLGNVALPNGLFLNSVRY